MVHLRSATFNPVAPEQAAAFPFSVPVVRALAGGALTFPSAVTFLVGENGSGKSTLLEALACAARAITVGSESVERDATLAAARALADAMRLSWSARKHRGFFMRSEDFFGFVKWNRATRHEMERALAAIDADPDLSDLARSQARMPYARELADMQRRYGDDLDANSHGESYFKLFASRFVPNGLYLLDEPEAPLSPMRQIGLLTMIKMQVEEHNAQFIIATHAPMLMAYPGATIYVLDGEEPRAVRYEDVEHVRLMKSFLSDPQRYLRHL